MEIKDFKNRKHLEEVVVDLYGKTTEVKQDTITGTEKELLAFNLKNGQSIWGVMAVATDYKPENIKKPNRGKIYKTKINGKTIKNAKGNKSSTS